MIRRSFFNHRLCYFFNKQRGIKRSKYINYLLLLIILFDAALIAMEDYEKKFNEYRKQHHTLTKESKGTQGGECCAKIRWEKKLKVKTFRFNAGIEIPADFHQDMALIGNFFQICGKSTYIKKYSDDFFKHNILIPHLSVVIRDDNEQQKFIRCGFLNLDHTHKNKVAVFVSGNMEYEKAVQEYNKFKEPIGEYYNQRLPYLNIIGKKEIEEITGKVAETRDDYHTEPRFWKIIFQQPEIIINKVMESLSLYDKNKIRLEDIILDFYSWFDVCISCQHQFKKENFKETVFSLLKEKFKEKGLSFFDEQLISSVYRVSSSKKLKESPDHMEDIGSDIYLEALSAAQVLLVTRESCGAYNTSEIEHYYKKIKASHFRSNNNAITLN